MIRPHFGSLAVRFRPGTRAVAQRAVADACHLDGSSRLALPGETFALVQVAAGSDPDPVRHARATAALARHPKVVQVTRVCRHGRTMLAATDRIWVGLVPGARGRAVLAGVRRRGGRLVERHDGDHLIRLPATIDPQRECARLSRIAAVAYAEPDHVIIGRGLAARAKTPARGRVQAALSGLGLPEAWRLQPIDSSTIVAVLDCGVYAKHADLLGAVTKGFDATGHGNATRPAPQDSHGTECAGLVAAIGRAGGIRGVAAGAGLFSVRVGFTPGTALAEYVTKPSWLVSGIEWAWRHGAAVLSMSFGGGPRSIPVERALARARASGRGGKGCVLVAAVGNDGTAGVEFPAAAAGVIGVAATGRNGRPASFSNRGMSVDIAAPGVNIKTITVPDPADGEPSLFLTDSGTSLSTPIVAGIAALVLAANPALTGAQVQSILAATATGPKRRDRRVGAGVVNAGRAVRAAQTRAGR